MDNKLKQQIEDAKKLLQKYAPKGEFLAYINKDEAKLLMAAGGSGLPVKQTGIPSFIPWLAIAVGVSTGLSLLGLYNQRKQIRQADRAGRRRQQVVNIKNKIDLAKQARAIISEKAAAQGARGVLMGRESTKAELDTVIDQYDEALYFAELGAMYDLNARDYRLAGALATNAAKMGGTLFQGVLTAAYVSQGPADKKPTRTGQIAGEIGSIPALI